MEKEDQFIKLVCDYLKLPIERVISKSREHDFCEARQMISYLLKLYTKMSLSAIARKLLYKSHAGVIRDIKMVKNYLDVEKTFIDKFKRLLIIAERLAWKLNKEERVKLPGYILEQGDICWFWNDSQVCSFPVISLFDRSYFNKELEEKFIALEFPADIFDHCVYAGEDILPERFRGKTYVAIKTAKYLENRIPITEVVSV